MGFGVTRGLSATVACGGTASVGGKVGGLEVRDKVGEAEVVGGKVGEPDVVGGKVGEPVVVGGRITGGVPSVVSNVSSCSSFKGVVLPRFLCLFIFFFIVNILLIIPAGSTFDSLFLF